MRVFIGADHRGFDLKENLKEWMSKNDIAFQDVGAFTLDENDDYPVYAKKLSESVSEDLISGKETRGIILCGSGVGVDIVANKFDGIRSGLGASRKQVESGRRDDDINVLAIASNYTDFEQAKQLIETFLKTEFDELAKRKRRLDEIKEIEKHN